MSARSLSLRTPFSRSSKALVSAVSLAVLVPLMALVGAAPASANADTGIATFPWTQDWSDTSLITTANDWSGVVGVQGHRGDDITTSTGVNPQTLTADGSATPLNVIANSTGPLATNTAGGIVEHEPTQAIALQGSGTADVPHLVFRLDLTGKTAARFAFDAKDLDASADNAVQPIAVQYRVGGTGAYTDLPAGFIPDATEQNTATLVTSRDVALPAETAGQAEVYVRVLTANAVGSDEWVGIDNITISAADAGGPLAAVDPADVTTPAFHPMTEFSLQASGGTSPYTWSTTSTLPAGVTLAADGTVSGTPTEKGTFTVTATVTDSAAAPATDSVTFDIVVTDPPALAVEPVNTTLNGTEGLPFRPFTVKATGGVPPYSWSIADGPAGVTIDPATGELSGTPTVNGSFTATVSATDDAATTATTSVTIEIAAPAPLKTIAELQGTGAASPFAGNGLSYRAQGVITGTYDNNVTPNTNNLQGFFMQTSGAPDTPGASDGIFVFMGSSASAADYPVGTSVEVTGTVSEFNGQTQISSSTYKLATIADLPAPQLATTIPGSDCTLGGCPDAATLDQLREAHESEAFDLSAADVTVTDSYSGGVGSSSMRGEFGLSLNSTQPLYHPLEVVSPSDSAGLAARTAYNAARGIILDDAGSISISATGNTGTNYPWLALDNTVRAGAAVTFKKPVILGYGFNAWRLQPETRVAPGTTGRDRVAFEQDRPATPDGVLGAEGNLKIATFNMLNYFVHPAEDWVATGGDDAAGTNRTCSYYNDRNGNRITARECTWTDPRLDPPSTLPDIGPRGAATAVSLSRQQVKEVAAINTMDADIVSLEEVENPVKLGYLDRDLPLKTLVDALNAAWDPADIAANGPRWAYVPSPRVEAQPTIAEQDAIRNAFIYNPRVVTTQGRSRIALNDPAFRNAREPLAQAFRHKDSLGADDAFFVITNHFKSKSSPQDPSTMPADSDNRDSGNGAGWYNGDRIRQARALDVFAKGLVEDTGIEAIFMAGDFNSYSKEDPVRTLEERGWSLVEADNGETSYFFGGLAGSLDHVFANAAGGAMLQGATIWPINANEPVYYEYSRFNYNATLLYDQTAFRSSDHNPEVVGIKAPATAAPAEVDTVQVLASNDFHGRLLDDPAGAGAGAAAMAGAVKQLRTDNPNTVFSMAGDVVGATTFESMAQNDKPTIDAMNEAGLEVSAAGNHEFDQGYDDLMNRIMSSTAADGGASWPYIAANVRLGDASGPYALKSDRTDGNFAHSNGATWWKDFPTLNGGQGISVGFVGAVTEDLPALVAGDAIAGLAITGVVDEVNAAADQLKTDGCGGEPCDLVVELVHEGAANAVCSTIQTDTTSTFGRIVHGANANVDAIISGHTHQKYNCKVSVADWSTRTVTERPVVSAGQYGANLNQLRFDFTPGTTDLVKIRQRVLALKDYDEDAATTAIVDDAVAFAAVEGAKPLGLVEDQFLRAQRKDEVGATVENRGGESTLGNLVAEIQRWRTGADIGVMNPGGLRQDLDISDDGTVTYREAVEVQPFANTLMTTELTGAQLKTLLEQQWQRDPDGNTPSRPFLRLGTSTGFTFTEDDSRGENDKVTGMWLDGVRIDPDDTTTTYTVSANSFVMGGGDNFRVLTQGTGTRDTGFTDLQATVDYLAAKAPVGGTPLVVDAAQHGVKASLPATSYAAGDQVSLDLASLSMTGATDVQETAVRLVHDGTELGTYPVTSVLPTTPYDLSGTATATFTVPAGVTDGITWLRLEGVTTGTVARIPLRTTDNRAVSTVTASASEMVAGTEGTVTVVVDPATATGGAELRDAEGNVIGTATLVDGQATITVPADALAEGTHTLTVAYLGDDAVKPDSVELVVTVQPAQVDKVGTTTTARAQTQVWGTAGSVAVTVAPSEATGGVELLLGDTIIATGELAGGTSTLVVPAKRLTVGSHALLVRYVGDDTHLGSSTSVTLDVVKQRPRLTLKRTKRVKLGRTAKVVAVVSTVGYVPTGKVRFIFQKKGSRKKVKVTRTLRRGTESAKAVARVRLKARGTYIVRVTYLGDATTAKARARTTLRVK